MRASNTRDGIAALIVVAVIGNAAALNAQQPAAAAPSAPAKPERVAVRVAGEEHELRGRLLHLDSAVVTLRIAAPDSMSNQIITIAMNRVVRIDREEHDSLIDGAILGALYVAACVKWWCAQGMSGGPHPPRDKWIGVAAGAGVGAAIDSVLFRRTPIYLAPGSPPGKQAALTFSFRF